MQCGPYRTFLQRMNAVYLTTYKNGGRDRTIHITSVTKFLFNSRESVEY